MIEKKLGKIESVTFGRVCGRSEEALGLQLRFSGAGWGVGTDHIIAPITDHDLDNRPEWNDDDDSGRLALADLVHKFQVVSLVKMMREAKVRDITQLKGVPVEITFENKVFRMCRVLTEVL